jgi:YesN/AraC family two-component response regulator
MFDFSITKKRFVHSVSGNPSMKNMHYHNSYELYYLEAGNREYFVEDQFFSVSSGDFVLIAPPKIHRTGEGYAQRTIIGFTEAFLLETYTPEAVHHMLKTFEKVVISPPDEKKEELKRLLKSIHNGMSSTDFAISIGMLLQQLSSCAQETPYDKRINHILKYINTNFAEISSIDQIAEHLHISKHYLCRLFKDSMGITLIDYLNTVRIKTACTYLETSDKDILEISELCGYNSSAYFSNVFKKVRGISPSQYRKKYRN